MGRFSLLAKVVLPGCVLLASVTPALADTMVLPPTSKWVLNKAEDSCVVRRTFGAKDRDVVLEMRQFEPGESAYFTIASKGLRVLQLAHPMVSIDPDVAATEYPQAIPVLTPSGHQGYTFAGSLRASDTPVKGGLAAALYDYEARERAITGITVTRGFAENFRLLTGSFHAPMAGMRQCVDELVTRWGIDAAAQKTLTRFATPTNRETWSGRLRFPMAKLVRNEHGLVRIRMTVDPSGAPASCHIQIKAKDDAFERAACDALMKYAQFEPALDANGKPIASYYVTSVIFLVG